MMQSRFDKFASLNIKKLKRTFHFRTFATPVNDYLQFQQKKKRFNKEEENFSYKRMHDKLHLIYVYIKSEQKLFLFHYK